MVKLTRTAGESNGIVIRVEGSLDAESAGELERLCGLPSPNLSDRTLELSGLRSADRAARSALARLRAGGWRFRGTSLYLRRLLEEVES